MPLKSEASPVFQTGLAGSRPVKADDGALTLAEGEKQYSFRFFGRLGSCLDIQKAQKPAPYSWTF
jgi:hypothetical protein